MEGDWDGKYKCMFMTASRSVGCISSKGEEPMTRGYGVGEGVA